MCHARILSRVDDCAEVKMSQLEERETRELAEKQLAALLPGFEPPDLPIPDLVLAAQLNLRTPLWIVLACRVIKGLVELYGFTQFAPDDAQLAPLSCSITGRSAPVSFYACYSLRPHIILRLLRLGQPPAFPRKVVALVHIFVCGSTSTHIYVYYM